MSTRNVLVTGASGFIGRHLVQCLVSRGDRVTCLARENSDLRPLKKLNCSIVYGDLVQQPENFASAVKGIDTVYHLAASTHAVRSADLIDINSAGMQSVLSGCADSDCPPTLVFVSSMAAVGPNPRSQPRVESDSCKPVSNYGRSKLACEKLAQEYSNRIPISIVRPPIVLGDGDRQGFALFNVIQRLGWHFVPTFSTFEFSVIHVDDLASALINVADQGRRLSGQPSSTEGIYFASANERPTYSVLGRMVGQAVGRSRTRVLRIAYPIMWTIATVNEIKGRVTSKAQFLNLDKLREATSGSITCSNQKINEEVGFTPAMTLNERLKQTANWYRQQGWLYESPNAQSPDHSRRVSGAR